LNSPNAKSKCSTFSKPLPSSSLACPS